MRDGRMEYALARGDVLQCPEGEYEITEVIGCGGMSIVYAANLRGSFLSFAVKEYFPWGTMLGEFAGQSL